MVQKTVINTNAQEPRRAMYNSIFPLSIRVLASPTESGETGIKIPLRIHKNIDDSLDDFYVEIIEGRHKGKRLKADPMPYMGRNQDCLGYYIPKGNIEHIFRFATYLNEQGKEESLIPVREIKGCRLKIVIKLGARKGEWIPSITKTVYM